MVQSLKLGGATNEEAQSGMRRINRLPIIIVIVLLVAFLGIIFYGLTSRGMFFST
ncbi:conjugal transfer protein TrbI, partial [Escherichia coli]|nr:conjugal transfer protein TrbI [Escherichia coli]